MVAFSPRIRLSRRPASTTEAPAIAAASVTAAPWAIHGYGSERWAVEAGYAVKLDPSLERVGMLLEPTTVVAKASKVFTEEERLAMKDRAQEQKAEARANRNKADGERDVLAAIAAMKGKDRALAKRLHEIVTEAAPDLWPKTWYGMPAYAKDGKVVCFFKSAAKFKSRYATFGFEDAAKIDAGTMWPTSFGLTKLSTDDEKKIGALVKKAVS